MTPLDISQIKVFTASTSPTIEALPQQVLHGLNEKGVVLLRGFNPDLHKFEALSRSLCGKFHNAATRYNSRESRGDNLSTMAPTRNCTLLVHSEGSHTPINSRKPDIAFFMCQTPPSETGGETIIVDGADFLNNMPPAWQQRFSTGIIYEANWSKVRWQREFSIETVDELKAHLASLKNVKYELHDETLRLVWLMPGITRSRSGKPVFAPGLLAHLPRMINPRYQNKNVIAHPLNKVYFGDGKPIGDDIISGLVDIQDALAYPHVWQKGDILIIDNTRYLHGRTITARDCERVIMTRFGWLNNIMPNE